MLPRTFFEVDAGEDCPMPHSLCVVLATDEEGSNSLVLLLQVADPLDAGAGCNCVLDEQGPGARCFLQRWAHVRRVPDGLAVLLFR
ncbi:hypothetical protein ACPA9J_30270 [Pseudomonas aeruginosa]